MTIFSLIPPEGVALEPGVRVLKADDYRLAIAAENLLVEAEKRAEEIRAQAEIDAEECRRRGYEEGLEAGKLEVAAQMFESVNASLEQLARMESSLVDVVLRSVRTILGSFDKVELAEQIVGHALRLVRDEKRVLLRVNPGDAEMVESRLDEITRRYPGIGRIDVAADQTLQPGGCVMETDIGVIDATLERQLQIIEDTFRRHLETGAG